MLVHRHAQHGNNRRLHERSPATFVTTIKARVAAVAQQLTHSLFDQLKGRGHAATFYTRGMQPCNNVGPNAHNQIGPRATAVKLSGLDESLANHGRLAI